MYTYIIKEASITVMMEGRPEIVSKDTPTFKMLRDALIEERWDEVKKLLSVKNVVEDFSAGEVTVDDGKVLYRGYEVHSSVAVKIVELLADGLNVTPLMNFLARVENNPLIDARRELYDFCEANGFMIDEEGYIIAYKAVRNDYKDKHSGRFDNSIGAIPTMKREDVDPDRRKTCSTGLHFAAFEYARSFGGGTDRLMVVRVDPADVVAIPADHNNQKGRAWRYVIIDEIMDGKPLQKKTFRSADFQVKAVPDAADTPDNTHKGITAALKASNWQIAGPNGAAAALGIPESTLRGRMKRLGIVRPN